LVCPHRYALEEHCRAPFASSTRIEVAGFLAPFFVELSKLSQHELGHTATHRKKFASGFKRHKKNFFLTLAINLKALSALGLPAPLLLDPRR
jgi:hypothetical protein